MPKLNGFKNFERRLRGEPDILETESTRSKFSERFDTVLGGGRHIVILDEIGHSDEGSEWDHIEPYDADAMGLYESDSDDIGYIEDDPDNDSDSSSERQERIRWFPYGFTDQGNPPSYYNQYGLRTSDVPTGIATTTSRSGQEPIHSEELERARELFLQYSGLVRSTSGEQEERVQSVCNVREGGDSSGEDSF